MKRDLRTRGFTLIEIIVYLALFSIIMGGAVIATFYVIDAVTRVESETQLVAEMDFALSKIDYLLSGAASVTGPGINTTGSTLTLATSDNTLDNPVTVTRAGGSVTFSSGSDTYVLTNTNVQAEELRFTHVEGGGNGTTPEYVETVLTMSTRTYIGRTLTRTATSTNYIKK